MASRTMRTARSRAATVEATSVRRVLFWASGALVTVSLAVMLLAEPARARGPVSVAPIADELVDAVVNISTRQSVKSASGQPLPRVPKGSPFEDLFEDFFNKKDGDEAPGRKVSSLGSGFVIDGKNGLIVTNNHVIENADEISAVFRDGTTLKVEKVLGTDPKTDLALLKVAPKHELKAVKFGSSEKLRVGDWVLAIGNPFGLGGSVSVGIISAKQRDIQSGPYDDYLQTDAAINKGNSGGPLFNMEGEVIGVNTAIISPTGGSIGIGFAVPSDVAMVVVDQLRQYGETRRGWLGVNIQSVSEDMTARLGVPAGSGALVARVAKGGPAENAGIKEGDVIIKFDGKVVRSMRALPRIVAQTAYGKTVDVELAREGQRQVIKVVVGRLEELEKSKTEAEDEGKREFLGMTLEVVSEALRTRFKLDAKATGVVVTAVEAGSPAASKEIKPGNLIVEAAQKKITKPSDFVDAVESVRKSGRSAILVRVEDTMGKLRFVALQLN